MTCALYQFRLAAVDLDPAKIAMPMLLGTELGEVERHTGEKPAQFLDGAQFTVSGIG